VLLILMLGRDVEWCKLVGLGCEHVVFARLYNVFYAIGFRRVQVL